MIVQELLLRYGLNSRAALYSRLKTLKIELAKDSNDKAFANPEQLEQLDLLHEHIKGGNKMSTFVKKLKANVVFNETEQFSEQYTEHKKDKISPITEQLTEQLTVKSTSAEILLENIIGTIIHNMSPSENSLQMHRDLKECSQEKWLLTTKQLEKLIGKRPKKLKSTNYCIFGGWKFVGKGKSGSQNLWQVEQL
ncbi:MAG: hypothetical protein SWX82_08645 [Cyanobacteriota bacterium]|nr:hypothetical protein [Cyanobacteriota bacterium]